MVIFVASARYTPYRWGRKIRKRIHDMIKLYIKIYHKSNTDRARNRARAYLVSPHALTDMPAPMLDSAEGGGLSLHQMTGVAEMLYFESNEPYGGIIAVEMGLGKAEQIIFLICASLKMQGAKYDPKPTLIVTPKSLFPMWMEQLKNWANRLMVLRYHDSHRKMTANRDDFATSHITTTYGDVMSEYKDYKAVNLAFQVQASQEGGLDSMPKLPPEKLRNLALMRTSWYHVIEEEAHISGTTLMELFKAVSSLKEQKQWAIRGTPFMDDYKNLQSPPRLFCRRGRIARRGTGLHWIG